jgi:hypothetical protein
VLKRKRPHPKLNTLHRLFWTTLRRVWSRWADVLVIVKSETVAGWHRAGFRLNWRRRSWPHCGRPKIICEIRVLIRRLADENPDWCESNCAVDSTRLSRQFFAWLSTERQSPLRVASAVRSCVSC